MRPQKEGGSLNYTRVENRAGTWSRYAGHMRLCDRCITTLISLYESTRKESDYQAEGEGRDDVVGVSRR